MEGYVFNIKPCIFGRNVVVTLLSIYLWLQFVLMSTIEILNYAIIIYCKTTS
jgi:hypothetical protein